MRIATRDIALTSSMAALFVILSRLPGFPVIGVEGAKIGIASTIALVFGFLLGPWLGASAAFFGGVASRVLFGASPFTWLTLPAMPLSAFTAGCLTRRKVGLLEGWMLSALVLGGLIFAWYGTWIGRIALAFPLLHWVGLAIILIFRRWLAFFIQCGEKMELSVCVALCSFSATMTAHLYGTLAFIAAIELALIKIPLDSALFLSLIPIATVERLIITIITTLLGVPIILALRRQILHS